MTPPLTLRAPSEDYRRIAVTPPAPLWKGLDAWNHRVHGWWSRRRQVALTLAEVARQAESLESGVAALTDEALRQTMAKVRERFLRKPSAVGDAERALALAHVRETARRTVGLYPYGVQLQGAAALDRCQLAEMATGEGKSLTATLAAVLAAWRGRPVHVVTVNDYLAGRDARKFATFFEWCGATVGTVLSPDDPRTRQQGYAADITYTTSKEVVADFLRDRLRLGTLTQPDRRLLRQTLDPRRFSTSELVMRGLGTAIVDEADSVLIDEAVTPLIICQPRANPAMTEAASVAATLAKPLVDGVHYRVDRRYREIELTDAAEPVLEEATAGLPRTWSGLGRRRELVVQALTARDLFLRDQHYVLQEGKVVIVDEFTGRLMLNRTWREGLHQAIEVKEGLVPTPPTEVLARLSFQRFFRTYPRLAGMTGTATESAPEFWQIYGQPVLRIPTHRPSRMVRLPDQVFRTSAERWAAVATEIATIHASGRPILVGTRSITASEALAERLGQLGLPCVVLNAVRSADEADIVARAGEQGRITIATNMAGRGTDILLGKGVAALGGLHVIAAEPNESARVDRQLFGRAARQGQPGSARRYFCWEDDILVRHLPASIRRRVAAATTPEAAQNQPVPSGSPAGAEGWRLQLAQRSLAWAQARSQGMAGRQRRQLLEHDTWLDEALAFAGREAGR